ncbi:MAG: ATP-binding protein [Anaerolineae bacterium]
MSLSSREQTSSGRQQWHLRRDRDLRVRLLELYVLFVGSVLVGALIFDSFARSSLEQDTKTADLALAEAVAHEADVFLFDGAHPNEALETLLKTVAVGRTTVVSIVDKAGNELVSSSGVPLPDGPDWVTWERSTIRIALRSKSGSFVTSAPDQREWVHSFASTPSGEWRVIVERPSAGIFAASEGFHRGLLIAIGIYLAGGVIFWLTLSRQLITPLERLEEFSGLIRWRGHVRPEEQVHLDHLSQRQDQVGSLARSLSGMAQGIEDRFVQLSILLETNRIVAGTLDAAEVMDNILRQVERLFGVDRCAVVALDKRAGVFRIRAGRGLSAQYVQQLRIAPSEPSSPSMRALRNKKPIQVSDTENDLAFVPFRPRAREEGYRSVLAIPLLTQHAPSAVLLLYKSEPYSYSYSELELASSFANHVTIALENATLYARSDERLQEQTRRLEAIVESLNDGLVLESLSSEVLYCNERAARLVGLSRGEARRQHSTDLMQRLLATADEPIEAEQKITAAVVKEGPRAVDVTRILPDGRTQDLRIHAFDVTDARGELMGRGQLWQDITSDKEVDRMKSALLSVVSHELRTPLAAIKGYATTLLARDVEWDEVAQREFLQTISDETDRLARLVKNLLDMTRIEAGNLPMRCEYHSLKELISRAASLTSPPAHRRIHMQLADDLPLVWVDASRIETVMRNLLDNAMKYTPPETEIEIHAHQNDGCVVVEVRDHGSGVPEPLRERIFERFFQAESRPMRQPGGVGLGLAICKGFIEAHGGRVWVDDAQPGAVFGFTLPVNHDNYHENSSR